RLAILSDRDRIARDFHDLVIQRLYATGLSLQGAMPLLTRPEAASRVSSAVDALDETIREIRSAIFSLQSRGEATRQGLRALVLEVVDQMTPALGFAPSLRLVGPLDEAVPADAGEQMLSALWEASPRSSGGCRSAEPPAVGPPAAVAARLLLEDPRGVGGGLGAALHAELGEEGGHVVLDRFLGEEEPVADLAVGEPFADQHEDAAFLVGEAAQGVGG